MIAALFVEEKGVYSGLPDVDVWGVSRDARKYAGPWPVVAHPPCERWGRYWSGGPMLAGTSRARLKGDDGGCFAAALRAVRVFGGVLEHPEASHAWRAHGLLPPPKTGGWLLVRDGWTCCVEQGHYGHRARKATWLYCSGTDRPPELMWGPAPKGVRLDDGFHSKEERRRAVRTGVCQRLSHGQRLATPPEFRDVLLLVARSVAPRPMTATVPSSDDERQADSSRHDSSQQPPRDP